MSAAISVRHLGSWTFGARHDLATAEPPHQPTLQQIKQLQDAVAAAPQIEFKPEHYFAPGMYVRKLAIAGGCIVVGKMHRHEHPTMLVQGSARINTDRGMETIHAPHIWISQPHAKRALVTLTDCVFVTVHLNPSDTQDLEAIEADVIVPEALIPYDDTRTDAGPFAIELQEAYA